MIWGCHSLEPHKSRTQINRETVSKPRSGILFGIILQTPILERNWSYQMTSRVNYPFCHLLVLPFCQIMFPSKYGIHSTEPPMNVKQTENSGNVRGGKTSSYILLCYDEIRTTHSWSPFMLRPFGRSLIPLTHEAHCAFLELEMLHISRSSSLH